MTGAIATSSRVTSLPVLDKLERLVREVDALQSKLILLVGLSGKTPLLHALAEQLKTTPVNVGAELGHRLAITPVLKRSFSAGELLREIANSVGNRAPLLLDNIEVLFEPGLKVNPLDLIKRLAHSRCVVAVWPGEMRDGHLVYASMGHPEYRDYSRDSVVIFETAQS
ncbi:BREX-3 system P-loop-containing protein BrxF [Burkholderia ambifaria]|jgi:hypothetical protein|uniref:BREX-3 system P-loop-containing protein BrxF n=1 Tax=Burkholderia ambifaria TaxID=152480 RepID=UPI000CFEE304|nr:BREX-3 system P-loop-containing protein BrxF [Burkholderia ambifaria]PRG07803.1 BREX-3 system P-loop-containing protein BrxF [Burkholderia ambifaria]QQJ97246.1 BREX-3 system P-loop-containing protein BrxF [Burkholderia ambifaria]